MVHLFGKNHHHNFFFLVLPKEMRQGIDSKNMKADFQTFRGNFNRAKSPWRNKENSKVLPKTRKQTVNKWNKKADSKVSATISKRKWKKGNNSQDSTGTQINLQKMQENIDILMILKNHNSTALLLPFLSPENNQHQPLAPQHQAATIRKKGLIVTFQRE